METTVQNQLILKKFYSINHGGIVRRMSKMKALAPDLLAIGGISSLDESEMQEIA